MENKDIKRGDRFLAELSRNGKVIVKINGCDCERFDELKRTLKEWANGFPGLVQLFSRNFTQGWHGNRWCYIGLHRKQKPQIS